MEIEAAAALLAGILSMRGIEAPAKLLIKLIKLGQQWGHFSDTHMLFSVSEKAKGSGESAEAAGCNNATAPPVILPCQDLDDQSEHPSDPGGIDPDKELNLFAPDPHDHWGKVRQEALAARDLSVTSKLVVPVIYEPRQQLKWEGLTFVAIKELRRGMLDYGPSSPLFTNMLGAESVEPGRGEESAGGGGVSVPARGGGGSSRRRRGGQGAPPALPGQADSQRGGNDPPPRRSLRTPARRNSDRGGFQRDWQKKKLCTKKKQNSKKKRLKK